ncbi:MAG TPA: sigma-70 family RNA polymerase sigma factor, partial [Xanthobacteraceae bacterium]|nr:sigma-70 family RNA polymerase sigma factor [Xanthobacteraceae bacterium]
QDKVYRFICRSFKDEGLAEDVTAETFCEVWRAAAATFKGQARVSTWLLAIARNLAISTLRRKSEQALDESAALNLEDGADNPEVAAAKKQRNAIVAHCLKSLSAPHRELIEFFYFQDKSIAEVAELMGIPVNTVKTRMFRARNLIGEMLKGYDIARFDSLDEASDESWLPQSVSFGRSASLEEAYA